MAMAALMVFMAGAFVRLQGSNRMPQFDIPSVDLPSPNAYNYVMRAAKLVVDGDELWVGSSFGRGYGARPASDESRTRNRGPSSSQNSAAPRYRERTLEQKEALINKNAAALAELRKGLTYQYMNPPLRSYDDEIPEFNKTRRLLSLLILDSQVKAERGDNAGAFQSSLEAMKLGADIPRGGILAHLAIGRSCQSAARNEIWRIYDSLTSDELKKAIYGLQKVISSEISEADAFEQEKWWGVASAVQLMKQPRWYAELNGSGERQVTDVSTFSADFLDTIEGIASNKGALVRDYAETMDRMIEESRKPYPLRNPVDPPKSGLINRTLWSSEYFRNISFRSTQNSTQNAFVLVSMALRAYKLDHGHYPDDLSELVPTYLKQVPKDPFAFSGPLRYIRTAESCLLYSVGPDGINDGGKADKTEDGDSSHRRSMGENSKGDILPPIVFD